MRFSLVLIIVVLVLALGLGACQPTASAPASAPASSPTSAPTSSSSSSSSVPVTGGTIEELAQTGNNVFANRCARCHGGSGQGGVAPALIGEKANLDKYQNAGELFRIVSTAMPKNAPGQLSQEEYAQVLAHLLLQNGFISGTTSFNTETLVQIRLNK